MKMELFVIQIILVGATFLVTLLCLLLPLKVFPRQPGRSLGAKSQRILSLSNCVSGGVFLGVCFIGLIPLVRDKFTEAFHTGGLHFTYPVTEVVVLVGFFMVLTVEQCVRSCKKRNKEAESVQMIKYPMDYFSYSEDDSTGSDDSEAEAERRNMKKTQSSNLPLLPNEQTPNGSSSTPNTTSSPTRHSKRRHNRVTIKTHGKKHSLEHQTAHSHGDHGHSHSVDITSGFSLRVAIMLLALSIHSLFEGMAVGLQDNLGKLINLFISVLAHECLVCFAVGISLAKQNAKMAVLVKLSLLFCSMIPIGILIGMGIGKIHNFGGYLASAIIQAIAAGTFLYVIFMETLPMEFENDQDPFVKVVFVFVGFVLMACLRVVTVDD